MRLLSAVLLIVAGLGLVSQARADIAYPAWGGEGLVFNPKCPKRTYVVGFHGRAGLWIDRIAMVCAPIRPGIGWSDDDKVETRAHGGWGGSWQTKTCATNEVVVATTTKISPSEHVIEIVFTCRNVSTRAERTVLFGGAFGGTYMEHQACPGGDYAAGAELHTGTYVHAFGIFCRDYKAPVVAKQDAAPAKLAIQAPAQQQAAAQAVPFTGLAGVWDMTTSEGVRYTLVLTVEGTGISGYFGASSGPGLEGTLSGPIDVGGLKFGYHYDQPKAGASGQGILAMSADGGTLAGDFVPDQDTTKRLHWSGTRRP